MPIRDSLIVAAIAVVFCVGCYAGNRSVSSCDGGRDACTEDDQAGRSEVERNGKRDAQANTETARMDACGKRCRKECINLYMILANANSSHGKIAAATPPSRDDLEDYMAIESLQWPSCPCSQAPAGEPDYYLAYEGPEPSDYPGLMAYERSGNHGEYRHVIIEDEVIFIHNSEWKKMMSDHRYKPEGERTKLRSGKMSSWPRRRSRN